MEKVIVLYEHPKNMEEFEKYYNNHLPLAAKLKGVSELELTKIVGKSDGSQPAFYRMAGIYFSDMDQLQETIGSPESQAAADLPKFATNGFKLMIGSL